MSGQDGLASGKAQRVEHCHDTPRDGTIGRWALVCVGGLAVLFGASVTIGVCAAVVVRAYSFAAGEP